jgi:imidazoleglycerol-phosphate dehydratase
MIKHFFYSFASGLKATLHINKKYSENVHHLIEAIFKSVAICLKNAIYINPRNK